MRLIKHVKFKIQKRAIFCACEPKHQGEAFYPLLKERKTTLDLKKVQNEKGVEEKWQKLHSVFDELGSEAFLNVNDSSASSIGSKTDPPDLKKNPKWRPETQLILSLFESFFVPWVTRF